jgi:hypothetical protein
MVEITPPRIESIANPGSGPQDQPAKRSRAKAAAAGKPAPQAFPMIDAAEGDEEKHQLDEMA